MPELKPVYDPWTTYDPKVIYYLVHIEHYVNEKVTPFTVICYLSKTGVLKEVNANLPLAQLFVPKTVSEDYLADKIEPICIPQPVPNIDLADFINAFMDEHKH